MCRAGVLFLLLTASIFAQNCSYWTGADLLYFTPLHCPYDMPPKTEPGVFGISNIQGKSNFGVRARLGYENSCFSSELSYLWFESYTHTKLEKLSEGIKLFTVALGYIYQSVDGKVGRILRPSKNSQFLLFANARWIDLVQADHFQLNLNENPANFLSGNQRASLKGGALGLGISHRTCFFGCLDLCGALNPMAVIASQNPGRSSQHFASQNNSAFINRPSRLTLIPALNIRLALGFAWEWKCLRTDWNLGYEIDYYWNAISFANNNLTVYQNLGFAGPFVGGKILF